MNYFNFIGISESEDGETLDLFVNMHDKPCRDKIHFMLDGHRWSYSSSIIYVCVTLP